MQSGECWYGDGGRRLTTTVNSAQKHQQPHQRPSSDWPGLQVYLCSLVTWHAVGPFSAIFTRAGLASSGDAAVAAGGMQTSACSGIHVVTDYSVSAIALISS